MFDAVATVYLDNEHDTEWGSISEVNGITRPRTLDSAFPSESSAFLLER